MVREAQHRGRRPSHREHHAQAARSLRGSAGSRRDARARPERGRRRAGAGWSKAVTARVKILELPERAQQLVGAGVIALSAVDQLRAIGKVAPALLEAVIAYLDDGNEWAAERLAREPGWVSTPPCATATPRRSPPTCRAPTRTNLRAAPGQEDRRALRAGREAAPPARPLRLRPTAGPLHRGRRRPGTRRRRADRIRERTADHRRPLPLPRARQGCDHAHRRGPPGQGDRGRRAEADRQAPRRGAGRPAHDRQARARPGAARARRPGARRQPRPRRRAAHRPRDGRPGRHGRGPVPRLRAARRRLRQLPVHADRRAHPAPRDGRGPADRRGAARRRHQDPQGRQPRTAEDRLRQPPRARAGDQVAVEVHRRRRHPRRALRPRARGARRRAVRAAPGAADQPADARHADGRRTRTSPRRRSRSSRARTCPPR